MADTSIIIVARRTGELMIRFKKPPKKQQNITNVSHLAGTREAFAGSVTAVL
jgi:hypothetical protein